MEELTTRSLSELSVVLPELIPIFNEDTEPLSILPNLLTIVKDRRLEILQWTNSATLILCNIIEANYPSKYWKKEVTSVFNSSNFFAMDFEGISYWRTIFKNLLARDSVGTGTDGFFDSFLRTFALIDSEGNLHVYRTM